MLYIVYYNILSVTYRKSNSNFFKKSSTFVYISNNVYSSLRGSDGYT